MGKGKHKRKISLKKLHQPPKGADGKGCLTRHAKRKKGDKCSHQWQGQLQAEGDKDLYSHDSTDHSYHSLCGDAFFQANVTQGASGRFFPRSYGKRRKGEKGFWKRQPTCKGKEWDPGPGKGKNFQDFREPYWHNAHHMVPNRQLNTTISDVAEEEAKDRAADLIYLVKGGLLKASYNLNDQVNMIILPNEQIVAAAIGLPRHLKGDKTGPDDKPEYRSHANYDKQVDDALIPIIEEYAEALREDLKKKHLEPSDNLSKAKLVQLSKDIYEEIKSKGRTMEGKPLADIVLKLASN